MATSYSKSIGKIVAVARNFAQELNNALPSEPIVFLKPPSSVIHAGKQIELPRGCTVHHEVELGVVIGRSGRDIPRGRAMDHVGGYALALDLTARNLQTQLAKRGYPWSLAKGFDTFTPLGGFIAKSAIPDPHAIQLWCKVDGVLRQNGNTRDMIFKIPELIEYISSAMRLEAGDVLLTGTPAGVGALERNGSIEAGMRSEAGADLASFQFRCIDRPGSGRFGPGDSRAQR